MGRVRIFFLAAVFGCISCNALTNSALDGDDEIGQAKTTCLAREFVDWANGDDVQRWLLDYNRSTTMQQVHERDASWAQLNDNDKVVQTVLQHPAAAALRALQNHFSVLGESFLIGANGGLVAATERTSDYWQGDEAQFTDTAKLPAGTFRIIKPTVDESAQAILAKMTIPIYDHRDGHKSTIAGVLVLGFDQLVVDFERPCLKE